MIRSILSYRHWIPLREFLPVTDPKNTYVAQDTTIQPDSSVITVRRYLDLYSGDGHFFDNGRDSLSDVTGVHGITLPMYREHFQPGHIRDGINARTAQKMAKYDDAVSRLGFNFRPLVFEIYGGALGEELDCFISQRTAIIAERDGLKPSIVNRYWLGRLSCLIRKQHAFVILNRVDRVLRRLFPNYNHPAQYEEVIQPLVLDRMDGLSE